MRSNAINNSAVTPSRSTNPTPTQYHPYHHAQHQQMSMSPNHAAMMSATMMAPQTPSPMQCYSGVSPLYCICPTCYYYRAYYAAAAASAAAAAPSPSSFSPMYAPQHNGNMGGGAMPMNWSPMMMAPPSPKHPLEYLDDATPKRLNSAAVPHLPLDVSRIRGNVVPTSCTSTGRGLLQQLLAQGDGEVTSFVFEEIKAELDKVALDTHGCHVLRSLLDVLSDKQLLGLMAAMNETLILNMCTLSQYTRRVLQAIFERQCLDLQPIVEVLASNAQYLAATQQGCISLIKIYQCCSPPQKAMLMAPLLPTLSELSTDPYGNYVVQCALEHSDKVTAARYVQDHFRGRLLDMSTNKFASNVVEKVVSCVNVPVTRRIVLDELVFNPAALQHLVEDPFGNFVVQAIIDNCNALNEFKRIVDRLRPLVSTTSYGTRIEARIRSKRNQLQPQHPHSSALANLRTPSHASSAAVSAAAPPVVATC